MVGLWGALAVLNQSQALALGALLLALCWLGGAQLAWLRAEALRLARTKVHFSGSTKKEAQHCLAQPSAMKVR